MLPCLRAPTRPRPKNIKAPAAEKQTKWQGHVVRIYADLSQMDLRSDKVGPFEHLRRVAYDSSTEWTKGGKPGKQDEVKEGSFVIVPGPRGC